MNTAENKAVYPKVVAGAIVRVHQKIHDITRKGQARDRVQVYEGLVIARNHGNQPGASVTVRKESFGVGVEKIFPLHSPTIEKIEVVKQIRVRRAKLGYVRSAKTKRGKAGW